MPDKLKGHFIKLYDGDFARLQAIYTSASPNFIIRELVRRHCNDVEQKLKGPQHVERPNLSRTLRPRSA
jgi:hypothetical protein